MEKTFTHNKKKAKIEIQSGSKDHLIIGHLEGKEVSRITVPVHDQVEDYINVMENDLKIQAEAKRKRSRSLKNILSEKGFK